MIPVLIPDDIIDMDPGRIESGVELGFHGQPFLGPGIGNAIHHRFKRA